MKTSIKAVILGLSLHGICLSTHAENAPEVSHSLKKMLGGLPIAGIKEEVEGMVSTLKKTSCGGDLTGCYTTASGPLQLYFFTSKQAQQTLLLVVNKKMAMPPLLKDNVQKALGGTALSAPIISISTTDFELDMVKMPPALQQVVRDNYFNVNTLSFSSGVQLAARADLGGGIKLAMESMGVQANQLTLRAAVVMPIPTDLAGAGGAAGGAAEAASHSDTLKKTGADALKPEAFVEFQFAPNASVQMGMPRMLLTDATFFLNNALVFGYKGNAIYEGVPNKKTLMQFQTPLTPEGVMDLADFSFRMATPSTFTLEDVAHMMVAMATPDPRLTRFGGGFIRDIESLKQPLLTATKPLSVFKVKNPVEHGEYKFGDSSKPFPVDAKYFNVALIGPLADGGPLLRFVSDTVVLGQKMGSVNAQADAKGFNGMVMENLSLKLGPLGKVTIQKMIAEAHIDKKTQMIRLKGNYGGQVVEVILEGTQLTINVPANCVNPFEIKAKLTFDANTNIAEVFDGQGGVNVDPSKITGCVGKELEAALNKIAGEYKSLSGYTASAANAELKKISDAANAELKKQEEAARKEYDKAKNAARDTASKANNAANQAFNDAGNAFKGIGKKKKHHKGPDPKFAASVFDWDYYYDNAQDVVKTKADLSTHWRDSGFNEGRQGSLEFSSIYYWRRYLDVQKLCAKSDHACVLDHWLDHGLRVGRQGSGSFSVASYLNRHKNLQAQFGREGYEDAMEDWQNIGQAEGRNGTPESAEEGPISGPVAGGGGGGGAWSDMDKCAGSYVDGFRIRSGGLVDTVQFHYANKGWAPLQGYNGNAAFKADVILPSGEYIVQVDYRAGDRVDAVSFKTNRGKTYGPYGGGGGTAYTYTVTPGEKLGCMAGRAGSSIDQLVFSSTGPR